MINKNQVNFLRLNLNKTNINEIVLLKRFGITRLENIPEDKYEEVKELLFSIKTRLRKGRRSYLRKRNTCKPEYRVT